MEKGTAMRYGTKGIVRTVLAVAAASSMIFVAGCGQSADAGTDGGSALPADGKVKLTFSGWVPGIEDAVKLWNEKNPNIQIEFKRISSDAQKNYSTQIEAGTAGDILQLADDGLADLVIDEQVQDISKYVGDKEDLFTKATWGTTQLGGGTYAVPQDSSPTAFMYRKDIFDKYGLTAPKTWDEYLDVARKLHQADPNLYITAFTPNEYSLFNSDFLQEGGSWYDTDNDTWKVTLDSKAAQTVAERWQTLLDEGLVKVVDMWTPDFWSAVNNGSIASFNYQAWFPVIVEENAPDLSGKWAIAQSPSDSGDGPWSDSGGSLNVVTKNCKYPEQAAKFITWLNTDPDSLSILIEKGGLFPAAKAGFENEAMTKPSDYWGGQVVSEEFIKAANNVKEGAMGGPLEGTGHTALQDEFGKVANGKETFKDALKNTSDALKKAISDKGLNVK